MRTGRDNARSGRDLFLARTVGPGLASGQVGLNLYPNLPKHDIEMHSPFIQKLEADLKPVLAEIQSRGLMVDINKLCQIIADLEGQRTLVEARVYELFDTSQRINLNSSEELVKLMTDLQVEGCHFPRTRSGRLSTAQNVLERIAHPAMEYLIEYRSLTKVIASLASFYNAVDRQNSRLYYKFTNDCASGRLYTQDMSIQNLPHEGRAAILPDEGKVFISADYDSFELHILSALAGDKYFRQCWQDGIDLHKKVVSDMMSILYEQVSESQRKIGKTLNFGIIYGQQAHGVGRSLDMSTSEARDLMDTYESKIPEIVKFKKSSVEKAREQGYVETYYGRPLLVIRKP